jgi:hypothetical protein
MVISCERVWQEISNYLEDDIDASLRSALEAHIQQCQRCTAILDGTRNIIHLYGDERLFPIPRGFDSRLQRKIAGSMPGRRGTAYGWLVAAAALGLFTGSLGLAISAASARPVERSQHAQPAKRIPAELNVLVAEHGKLFHIAGCTFLHEKPSRIRTLTASDAMKEGYTPCARCLGEYLSHLAGTFLRKQTWSAFLR